MATAKTDSQWPPFVTLREEDPAGELTKALWRACCCSGTPETVTEEFWVRNNWVPHADEHPINRQTKKRVKSKKDARVKRLASAVLAKDLLAVEPGDALVDCYRSQEAADVDCYRSQEVTPSASPRDVPPSPNVDSSSVRPRIRRSDDSLPGPAPKRREMLDTTILDTNAMERMILSTNDALGLYGEALTRSWTSHEPKIPAAIPADNADCRYLMDVEAPLPQLPAGVFQPEQLRIFDQLNESMLRGSATVSDGLIDSGPVSVMTGSSVSSLDSDTAHDLLVQFEQITAENSTIAQVQYIKELQQISFDARFSMDGSIIIWGRLPTQLYEFIINRHASTSIGKAKEDVLLGRLLDLKLKAVRSFRSPAIVKLDDCASQAEVQKMETSMTRLVERCSSEGQAPTGVTDVVYYIKDDRKASPELSSVYNAAIIEAVMSAWRALGNAPLDDHPDFQRVSDAHEQRRRDIVSAENALSASVLAWAARSDADADFQHVQHADAVTPPSAPRQLSASGESSASPRDLAPALGGALGLAGPPTAVSEQPSEQPSPRMTPAASTKHIDGASEPQPILPSNLPSWPASVTSTPAVSEQPSEQPSPRMASVHHAVPPLSMAGIQCAAVGTPLPSDVGSVTEDEVWQSADEGEDEASSDHAATPSPRMEILGCMHSCTLARRVLFAALTLIIVPRIAFLMYQGDVSSVTPNSTAATTSLTGSDETSNLTTADLTELDVERACELLPHKVNKYISWSAENVEQENYNLLVLGGSGLGKDVALGALFRGQDPKWRHLLLLEIRQHADEALQTCKERRMLLGDEQSAKERRDFGRAKELRAERLAKDADIRSKLKSFEDTESVYEERGKKIQGLEEAIGAIKANQTRLSDNGEYDEAEALQGELEGLLAEHAKMMTRWTDVTETTAPNITMQIEVKTIRRLPVAPGSSTMIDVQLINTPGYGSIIHSLEDSYSMIDHEIETRIGLHASMSGRKKLHESMLVHTCIFFIAPHRLMEADLQMMAKLQDRCPLIPVIAKADTMTIEEATRFKDTVRRELKVRNISTAAVDFNLLHDISERNGVEHRLPFAIVSARAPDSSGLAQRCYLWGCANTDNPKHSELSVLRELLLGEWQSLRNQAIDKIDTELQIRSGDPWKEQERKKKAEEEMAQRLEFERRACPNELVETKALLEETSEALKQKNATFDETKAALSETEATLATAKGTLQQKETTLDETKATLDETKATLDETKATLATTKGTLQQKETTLDETKAELRETKATLAGLQKQVRTKESVINSKDSEIKSKASEITKLENQVDRLSRTSRAAEEKLQKYCKTLYSTPSICRLKVDG